MSGLGEVVARAIHDADDSIDMRYATHVAETIQPAILDWVRERLAGVEDEIGQAVMQPGAVIDAVAEALGVGEVRG